MGLQFGPLLSLEGSELWALVLKVVYTGVNMIVEDAKLGAHIREP